MVLDLGQSSAETGMLCPHCKVMLAMATRANIEIDYCPKCRGVWLDRGELDKIIERSVAEVAPKQAPERRETRADRDKYERKKDDRKDYKKRRKSWLAEIFDELT